MKGVNTESGSPEIGTLQEFHLGRYKNLSRYLRPFVPGPKSLKMLNCLIREAPASFKH